MTPLAVLAALLPAVLLLAAPAQAQTQVLGSDAAACKPGGGPAILAQIAGLKDRKGRIKLELYPADEADFLADDTVLLAAGKTFRRVWTTIPPSGQVQVCIRVPRPGRYALLVTHDRDGKNKFNFFADGAGFPGPGKIGMSRPKVERALVDVGSSTAERTVQMQYLHGLGGFSPTKDE
ncbi:DUF2141 domain-containing protein [Sphingomonas melonis]|jgi:uncharacterized protein (DUF2141 family)|uniref:Uncharacterized protein (DUF2141 family) n=1 Tax=Sphingomonas melonis TaxID=152682 RepID=A0A7Y9JYY0_9SPHN|nr:DUF2141 domain-containing protein [Sphingomonas melonis]NYD88263.1 uncharacterized protein (DUF2141 family) [Sphingomonas melonis]